MLKWSEPKRTTGMNVYAKKTMKNNKWFQGSDKHVTATLLSNESDRIIKASFFFDPDKCPKPFCAGDKVRLVGTRLQIWMGCLQLTGKNIQFGQSVMSLSLSNALEAWQYVISVQPLITLRKCPPGAQRQFPKLTLMVIVKMWGYAITTKGTQTSTIESMLYYMLIFVHRWRRAR